MRGKAMSGAPIISGKNQLPRPPNNEGMIMKNTMIRPWAVTSTLNSCPSPPRIPAPGAASSTRKRSENNPPIRPPITARIR